MKRILLTIFFGLRWEHQYTKCPDSDNNADITPAYNVLPKIATFITTCPKTIGLILGLSP
jgi:hypothetical protein